jgi:hypothetical protein
MKSRHWNRFCMSSQLVGSTTMKKSANVIVGKSMGGEQSRICPGRRAQQARCARVVGSEGCDASASQRERSPYAPPAMTDAIFHVEGDRAIPTELARGPWSPDAQHGGPAAALLARALERADPGPASFVARLTIELLRPVPLTPLVVRARTVRPGRKVQWLEATLLANDAEVARATALRLRVDPSLDLPVPDLGPTPLPPPGASEPFGIEFPQAASTGFWQAMELRVAAGSFVEVGEATIWFRLVVPVVAGEDPTPLQRVAAAADFGNGVSAALERGRYLFINPDLTIYLHRDAVGEWVALEARTFAESRGVGLAESAVHDERHRIGRSLQSLLLDRL